MSKTVGGSSSAARMRTSRLSVQSSQPCSKFWSMSNSSRRSARCSQGEVGDGGCESWPRGDRDRARRWAALTPEDSSS